jgi:serine/threonine protein kinase
MSDIQHYYLKFGILLVMKSESYEFLKELDNSHVTIGFGSYGTVKLAKNTDSKELVAIKLVH